MYVCLNSTQALCWVNRKHVWVLHPLIKKSCHSPTINFFTDIQVKVYFEPWYRGGQTSDLRMTLTWGNFVGLSHKNWVFGGPQGVEFILVKLFSILMPLAAGALTRIWSGSCPKKVLFTLISWTDFISVLISKIVELSSGWRGDLPLVELNVSLMFLTR